MAYGTAIRRGLYIAGKIDKKYNLNKIFIDKYFPPGYRKTAKQLVDIAGVFGGGYGLYNIYNEITGNAIQKPNVKPIQTNRFNKTYSGNKSGYRSRRKYCPPNTNRRRRYVYT